MKLHSSKRSAFTLLEIMLVVTIIALLLGSAIFAFRGKLEFAKTTRVQSDLQSIATSLLVYQSQNGFYPSTEQGLKALVARPDSDPRPRQWHQQLDNVPLDPWSHEYHYIQPGKHNTGSYDLYSSGPDGIPDNDDDMGNWQQSQP